MGCLLRQCKFRTNKARRQHLWKKDRSREKVGYVLGGAQIDIVGPSGNAASYGHRLQPALLQQESGHPTALAITAIDQIA